MDVRFFTNVTFVKSITKIVDRPSPELPEIAFVGRANVGKSSLLNAICNRRSLAKTSSVPGKTRLINYFKVNGVCYFVDLPGYGYSKLPQKIRDEWAEMIEEYLKKSDQLRLICLLIDSRHGILENDKKMIDWMNFYQKPFSVILTKFDKISRSKLNSQVNQIYKQMPDNHILPVSIKNEHSISAINEYLYSLL